jgi:hypothetical protein
MGAIVKAKPAFLNGQVTLIKYAASDATDGSFRIAAEFAAIGTAQIESQFRVGSPVPAALANASGYADMLALKRVAGSPTLLSSTITREHGIKFISCTYGSTISDSGENNQVTQTFSTSTDLRSFSGSINILGDLGTESASFSFDYYATSASVDSSVGSANPAGASLGNPINVRAEGSLGGVSDYVRSFNVTSRQTYRNNLGQTRHVVTITPTYVQSIFSKNVRVTIQDLQAAQVTASSTLFRYVF